MHSFSHIKPEAGINSVLERIQELNSHIRNLEQRAKTLEKENTFSKVLNDVQALAMKQKFAPIIAQAAIEHKVDPKLVTAVIEQESRFNPQAVSKSGALGLMQLMPETAKSVGVNNPLNPEESIRGGTKYLSSLLNRYQGNVILALSAYNAGPGNVDKYNGVPPFEETQNYVKGVLDKMQS